MWQTLRSEVEQEQRLSDDGVQLRLQALQPIWVDQMLPRSKAMGKDLRKVVTRFNEMAEIMIAFDAALRHEEVLGLPPTEFAAPQRLTARRGQVSFICTAMLHSGSALASVTVA